MTVLWVHEVVIDVGPRLPAPAQPGILRRACLRLRRRLPQTTRSERAADPVAGKGMDDQVRPVHHASPLSSLSNTASPSWTRPAFKPRARR